MSADGSLGGITPARDRRSSAGGALPTHVPATDLVEGIQPQPGVVPTISGTKPLLQGKLILLMSELASAHLWNKRARAPRR